MELQGNIGFIGGGRMGEALIQGLLKSGIISADCIHVTDPDTDRRQLLADTYKIKTYDSDNSIQVLADCETIILAVKPQIMDTVLQSLKKDINA